MTIKREVVGTAFAPTPTVRLQDKEGSKFVGKLLGSRSTKFGLAFSFEAIEGDAPITLKNTDGKGYSPIDVQPGQPVSVLSSKGGQLETKLRECKEGENVEIVFEGWGRSSGSGNEFHIYTVNIIE